MEIRELSFFQNFQCLGADCPETCCRGWLIPLEPEDIERMGQEKGLFRLRYLLATGWGVKKHFNSSSGICPFLNRKGLCSMQLEKGHDFLPEACREYPRFYRNWGPWEERMIDLSCIAGARLWFDHFRDLTFTSHEGEPVSGKDSTNEDETYLKALECLRQKMTEALLKADSLQDVQHVLFVIDDFAKELQGTYLHASDTRIAHAKMLDFDKKLCKPEEGKTLFPFPAQTYQKLMKTHLFSERLAHANPSLHMLCKLYYDEADFPNRFSKMWDTWAASFLERYPKYIPYYASLYAYYLYQHFLWTYEDYSFLKNIRTGLIHINMKFLFDVLLERAQKTISDDDFISTISVYNRRAYFNMKILDEMYAAVQNI